jgi:hypothetical protein
MIGPGAPFALWYYSCRCDAQVFVMTYGVVWDYCPIAHLHIVKHVSDGEVSIMFSCGGVWSSLISCVALCAGPVGRKRSGDPSTSQLV